MRLTELFENHVRTGKDKYAVTNADVYDKRWNPEAEYYARLEKDRTKEMWERSEGAVPVVTEDDCEQDSFPWTPEPLPGEKGSPGYRGEQEARQRAGAAYKPYHKHDPYFIEPDYPAEEL